MFCIYYMYVEVFCVCGEGGRGGGECFSIFVTQSTATAVVFFFVCCACMFGCGELSHWLLAIGVCDIFIFLRLLIDSLLLRFCFHLSIGVFWFWCFEFTIFLCSACCCCLAMGHSVHPFCRFTLLSLGSLFFFLYCISLWGFQIERHYTQA